MSCNALFAPSNTRNQQKHLIEFKAGKMYMKENMVHPDKRKGLLYVYQSDDALMHFCWKDRTSGVVEDVSKYNLRFELSLCCNSNFYRAVIELSITYVSSRI